MRAANLFSDDWDEQRERPVYTWTVARQQTA